MQAIRMRLVDLGGSLRLLGIQDVVGHPVTTVPLVDGGDAPSFGPFGPPKQATWRQSGMRITVRIHAVGAVVVRIAQDTDSLDEGPAEGILDDIVGRVSAHLREHLYETYDARAVEDWDIRVVPHFDEDAARRFTASDDAPLRRGDDVVLVGQDRAVIRCDDPLDIIDVLELARAELLEYRAYDQYLDTRLDGALDGVDRLWGAGGWFRSARRTLRLMSQVRVEVARMTDPLHGTDKLFGDRFTWRLHEHLQQKLRVRSWDKAVQHKVDVLEDLFQTVQEETHHRRAIVLETMIVLLFIVDLWAIFLLPH